MRPVARCGHRASVLSKLKELSPSQRLHVLLERTRLSTHHSSLCASTRRMRGVFPVQEGEEDRRARVDAADQLLRPRPRDPAAAQREAEHDKVWRGELQRETEMLVKSASPRACVHRKNAWIRSCRSKV